MHLLSASTPAVVGSAIDLANSSLANCNSIQSTDKCASRMTLERYDVESCGEILIVQELSLLRSPGVFTLLQFVCTVVQRIVSLGSENVLHTRHGVVVAAPMFQCVSRVNVCSSLP